ncbi:EamA family transporter [Burkholderia sp. AW49-1]
MLIGLVLGLGLTGTGITYILYYFIVGRLRAVAASSVTYIPPVVALLMGSWLAQEPTDAVELFAMGAILGGVFLLQRGRQPRASAARSPAKATGQGRRVV